MRKWSLCCGCMRAGARKLRAHESRQCGARHISCNMTPWQAEK